MSKPLLRDLQDLVSNNVITPETAEQITRYYDSKQDPPSNKFTIVLGILGAILVGSGIVLLLAHNWDLLNRTLKSIIAFLPLALGQGLCIYTLLRKRENRVWQEVSATLLFFAVATSISLISQIYHIEGDLPAFLLTWLFLMVPVIYLLNSSIVSLLSIACITWYACLKGYSYDSGYPWMYVFFMLWIVPHYYRFARFYRHSGFFHWHNWMLVASLCIVLGTFGTSRSGVGGYIALFGLLYAIGNSSYFKEYKLWGNPAYLLGLVGLLVLCMVLSYGSFWSFVIERHGYFSNPLAYITLALLIGILLLRQWDPVALCSIVICLMTLFPANGSLYAFITNLCLVAIAIWYIRKGSAQNHLGILNFGLLIIAILALLRFFDGGIPFIWRGVFFVATGIGFFAANYLLLKKRKAIRS